MQTLLYSLQEVEMNTRNILPKGECPFCDADSGHVSHWGMSEIGWSQMKQTHDAGHQTPKGQPKSSCCGAACPKCGQYGNHLHCNSFELIETSNSTTPPPLGNASEGDQHVAGDSRVNLPSRWDVAERNKAEQSPAAPSRHYVRVCNCPKHDCPVHGEQPETITTVTSTTPSSQLTTIACGAIKETEEQLAERMSNPQASEEVRTLAKSEVRRLVMNQDAAVDFVLRLQRERDEYKADAERMVKCIRILTNYWLHERKYNHSVDVVYPRSMYDFFKDIISSLHHKYE